MVTIPKSHGVVTCFLLFARVIYEFTSSFPNSIIALTVSQVDYIHVGIKQYSLQLDLLIHLELGIGLLFFLSLDFFYPSRNTVPW